MKALNHHHDWIGMNYVSESFKTDRQINPDLKEYMAYTKTSARVQNLQNADQLRTNKQFIDAIAKATTIQHYEKKAPATHRC